MLETVDGMADIDVVKKGSRAWLWVVMLLVLAIVAWFLMAGSRPQTVGQLEPALPHLLECVNA